MQSLFIIHDIIFGPLKTIPLDKIPPAKRERAIQSDKIRKFEILLGQKSTEQELQDKLKEYCQKHAAKPELRKYLFDDDSKPGEQSLQEVTQQETALLFGALNRKYNYFDAKDTIARNLYDTCYKLCEFVAMFAENSSLEEIGERAYKVLVFFSPDDLSVGGDNVSGLISKIDKFIKDHMSSTSSPIHDIGMHTLPRHDTEGEDIFLHWKSKIDVLGYSLIRHFSDIKDISEFVGKQSDQGKELDLDSNGIPQTLALFEHLLGTAIYDDAGEKFDKILDIYKFYKVPKATYQRTIELVKTGKLKISENGNLLSKEKDEIPDVVVEIKEDKYYLVKLPSENPRALILGHITDCCQSIGSEEEGTTLQGITMSSYGFYVFIKVDEKDFDPTSIDWDNFEFKDGRSTGNKIIGQTCVWKGYNEALVLDSLEILQGFRKEVDIVNTLVKLSQNSAVVESSATRLMIGLGGKTREILKQGPERIVKSHAPEIPKEGKQCYDSIQQHEFYVSQKLQDLRGELQEASGSPHEHVICLKQGEVLQSLDQEMIKALAQLTDYQLWTGALPLKQCTSKENLLSFFKSMNSLELKQNEKYKYLFSKGCEFIQKSILFATGQITINDLESIDLDHLKCLTSPPAIELMILGVSIHELKGEKLEDTKRQVLKAMAIHLFNEDKINLTSIDNAEIKTVDILIENYTICLQHNLKVSELSKLGSGQMDVVFSDSAVLCYAREIISPQDIMHMSHEQMEYLTTDPVRRAYHSGFVKISDLTEHNKEKTLELTSPKAVQAYKKYFMTVSDLKDLKIPQIQLLLSTVAQEIYLQGGATYKDLIGIAPKLLMHLAIDSGCRSLYKKQVQAKDFLGSNVYYTQVNTIKKIFKVFCEYKIDEYDELWIKNLPHKLLNLMLSEQAIKSFSDGFIKISDLRALTTECMETLLNIDAHDLFTKLNITLSDLLGLGLDKLQLFASSSQYNLH